MAASTINIAEFRCQPRTRRGMHVATRRPQENTTLKVVERDPEPVVTQTEPQSSNPPGVLSIAGGRERRTMREPRLNRPFPFRRRANLVRFNEPHVAVMRAPVRSQQIALGAADDDRDVPPAA